MPTIPKVCEWCGNDFDAPAREVRRGRGRYCSVSCKSAYGRSLQDQSGESNPAWKGGVWKANTLAKAREWNQSNPEKRRAHHVVEHELKMGRLGRSSCEKCGADEHVDAHHHDYAKPLEVTWLCRSCHLSAHRTVA